jgi:cysteinyl-tRNA synthetase
MLTLYNTLTKKKEAFQPLDPPQVRMYTCGPTVYDYVHIGNLRSYVAADLLRRVLEHAGYHVRHVENITDVGHLTADDIAQGDSGEDKIAKKARAEQTSPEAIARFYTDYYHQTGAALNLLLPHVEPKATEHISAMIALIEKLVATGHAYTKNGHVFFDVTSFPAYGRLSGNTLDQLKVGARLEEHPDKRNPWDFALWLKAPEGHLMHWPSPWSEGYPGWHIECSAMNLATLGPTIDIHTGGEDNIFPHHEAEIAQSECGNAAPFTRYWVHTRHLLVDGEKMSKSRGNFYTLEHVLERGFSAMDLRLAYLGAHYRSQMNFTWEVLEQARTNLESLRNTLRRLNQYAAPSGVTETSEALIEKTRHAFFAALEDDLNTPAALAVALEFATMTNKLIDERALAAALPFRELLGQIFSVFGLRGDNDEEIPAPVAALVALRETARRERDFSRADELRRDIAAQGFLLEDTPTGPQVRRA